MVHSLTSELDAIKGEKAAAEAAQDGLVKKATAAEQKLKVVSEELARTKEESKAAIDAAKAEAEKLKKDSAAGQSSKKELEKLQKQLADSTAASEAAVEGAKAEVEKLKQQVSEGQAALKSARAEVEALKEKAQLAGEVQGLKQKLSQEVAAAAELKAQVDKLKAQVAKAEQAKQGEVSKVQEELAELRRALAAKDEEIEKKYTPLVLAKDASLGIGKLVREASEYSSWTASLAKANVLEGSSKVLEVTTPVVAEGVAAAQPLVRQGSVRACELWTKVAESIKPHYTEHVHPHYERHLHDHVLTLSAKSRQAWVETVRPGIEQAWALTKQKSGEWAADGQRLGAQASEEVGKLHGQAVDWVNSSEAAANQGEALITAALTLLGLALLIILRWQIIWLTVKLPLKTVLGTLRTIWATITGLLWAVIRIVFWPFFLFRRSAAKAETPKAKGAKGAAPAGDKKAAATPLKNVKPAQANRRV